MQQATMSLSVCVYDPSRPWLMRKRRQLLRYICKCLCVRVCVCARACARSLYSI